MWSYKPFKKHAAAQAWMDKNKHRYQCTLVFVHNGYAVEYKRLRVIG